MKLNYFRIKKAIEGLSLGDMNIIERKITKLRLQSIFHLRCEHLSLEYIKEDILHNILEKFYKKNPTYIIIHSIYLKDLIEDLKGNSMEEIYLSTLEYILNINFEKNLKGDIYAYSIGQNLHILFNLDGTVLIDINAKPIIVKYYDKIKAYIATFMLKDDITEYRLRYRKVANIELECLNKSGYLYTKFPDKVEEEKEEPLIPSCSYKIVYDDTILYNGMTEKQLKNIIFSLPKCDYSNFIISVFKKDYKNTMYDVYYNNNFNQLKNTLYSAIKKNWELHPRLSLKMWLDFFKEKHDELKNKEEEFYYFEGYCNTEIGENDDIIPNSEFEKYLNKKIPLYADNSTPIGNAVIDKIDNYGVHVKCRLPKNDIFVKTNIIPNIENGSLKYLGHAASIFPVNSDTVPRIYVVQCLHSINILTINYNAKCVIWPPKKLATSRFVGNLDEIKDNDCQKEYTIEDIASKNILINAKTENEAIEIIKYFFNNNVNLNKFTLEDNGWYMYGSKSCYGINNGYITLKSKEFIDKKYKVIFIDEIKKGVI